MDQLKVLGRVLLLVAVWAAGWLLLHGEQYAPYLESHFAVSSAFVLQIVISFVAGVIFEIAMLALVVRVEGVHDFRKFFKIETLDVKGIWLTFGVGLAVQIINLLFLWNLVLKPARDFLASLGLTGGSIGLGTGGIAPPLSPLQAAFMTVFLLAFWWLEVPEELFFRGYVQNRLQGIVGKNTAAFLSALIWDVCHLWSLVNIVERFLYGLVYAVVFRLRQNTTPTMIVHPIGNRSLLLAVLIPQIWGATLDQNSPWLWGLTLLIYVALLFLAIGGWRLLKLDRGAAQVDAPGAGGSAG